MQQGALFITSLLVLKKMTLRNQNFYTFSKGDSPFDM